MQDNSVKNGEQLNKVGRVNNIAHSVVFNDKVDVRINQITTGQAIAFYSSFSNGCTQAIGAVCHRMLWRL